MGWDGGGGWLGLAWIAILTRERPQILHGG